MDASKVVVITGASSGIGAALAVRLGREGLRLALGARNAEKLKAVAVEAAPEGLALAVPADVTRRADVDKLRDTALDRFGRIDVWVNNAGRGISRPVLELTDADVDEMIAVNVKSALYGMQAIVPYFIERGQGHVINVSSVLARLPTASIRSAYNAAKAALNAAHSKGPSPRPPAHMPQPQTVEEVVEVIARLIDAPRAEIFTNPAAAAVVERYVRDVGAFEEQM